jgi:hypothetical protein
MMTTMTDSECIVFYISRSLLSVTQTVCDRIYAVQISMPQIVEFSFFLKARVVAISSHSSLPFRAQNLRHTNTAMNREKIKEWKKKKVIFIIDDVPWFFFLSLFLFLSFAVKVPEWYTNELNEWMNDSLCVSLADSFDTNSRSPMKTRKWKKERM